MLAFTNPASTMYRKGNEPGARISAPDLGPTQVIPLPEHCSDISIPHQSILSWNFYFINDLFQMIYIMCLAHA